MDNILHRRIIEEVLKVLKTKSFKEQTYIDNRPKSKLRKIIYEIKESDLTDTQTSGFSFVKEDKTIVLTINKNQNTTDFFDECSDLNFTAEWNYDKKHPNKIEEYLINSEIVELIIELITKINNKKIQYKLLRYITKYFL